MIFFSALHSVQLQDDHARGDDAAYPKVGENRVRHVEAVDALAAEFGVAADAAAAKGLEA